MKVLALVLALVAVAVCQNCDIDRSWSQYQTASRYAGGIWAEKELIGWGMDGDNKWNDFWSFRTTASSSRTHYDRVTCGFRSGARELPNYVAFCGDCSLTSAADNTCGCYPYHDVADNFLPYPGPESGEAPVAPEGWPTAWVAGNPPFEQFPSSDGVGAWTLENCQQYKPQYVYYYTYKLKISGNGEFQKSMGISKGFEPSQESWNDFCEDVFANENNCYVPSTAGGSNDDDDERLEGAEYQYQMGEWRENDSNDIQFFHYHFENGCHMKARNRKYPSAVYCGDAAGWTYGSGTTAHVRFGCDVGTFFDTETDSGRDVDDSDCDSVYVAFDAVNPLELTKDEYDTGRTSSFAPVASLVRGLDGTDCWYESSFTDHRQGLPDYRTKCSAGVLAVPFVALISTIMMVLRNMF